MKFKICWNSCYYFDGPMAGECISEEYGRKVFSIPTDLDVPLCSVYNLYDTDVLPEDLDVLKEVPVLCTLKAEDFDYEMV